jgi:hypothetical protein
MPKRTFIVRVTWSNRLRHLVLQATTRYWIPVNKMNQRSINMSPHTHQIYIDTYMSTCTNIISIHRSFHIELRPLMSVRPTRPPTLSVVLSHRPAASDHYIPLSHNYCLINAAIFLPQVYMHTRTGTQSDPPHNTRPSKLACSEIHTRPPSSISPQSLNIGTPEMCRA